VRRPTGLLLVVCALAAAGYAAGAAMAQQPGDPVIAAAPGGAYAVAVPGLVGGPVLAADSVAFAVQNTARERLFRVGAASAAGWRTLYVPPGRPRMFADAIVASASRVVVLRHRAGRVQSCVVGGECTPSPDDVVGGSPAGPLRRLFGYTERLAPRRSCRRRIAQLQDDVSLGGDRIAYVRRVRCLAPRRPGRSQVVVRDLRTGAVRVVHRGAAGRVQLAGGFVAIERSGRRRDGPVMVKNVRTGRVAYRAEISYADHFSLGADGTLARTLFPEECCSLVGRLGWYSPRSPRLHRLPNRVAIFNGPPLAYGGGRIAYVSRYDGDGSGELSVTDLRGRARDFASFRTPEALEAFSFDGTRLAFAHTRYRPDQGPADDGLPSICVGDRILVQESASVIEVHPVTVPGRLPTASLPLAAPYRSRAHERPECPYRD
jgi:hypothetical protein